MSNNSFYLKGWLISIVSFLIVMASENTNKVTVVTISLFLTLSFGI